MIIDLFPAEEYDKNHMESPEKKKEEPRIMTEEQITEEMKKQNLPINEESIKIFVEKNKIIRENIILSDTD